MRHRTRGRQQRATTCTHDVPTELVELSLRAWQYHFEFLNLGYAAYLDFFGFCKEAFPGISDLGIAKMVQGIEVDLFRPDDELRRLARLAVELDVADALSRRHRRQALAAVARRRAAEEWSREWEAAKDPWFNFSSGTASTTPTRCGLDHLDIPFGFMRGYIRKLQAGEEIDTADRGDRSPSATGSPREYRALLDGDDKADFDEKLGLSPHGVPVRREPQLLRRALGHRRDLAQDPRARRGVRQGRVLGRRRRHLHAAARRDPDGDLRHDVSAGPSAPPRSARRTGPT